MSPKVAPSDMMRRLVAIIALTLIAATGITTAAGTRASAAGADSASFTWLSATLTNDAGTPGVPDVGDTVTLAFEVAVSADAPGNLNWLMLLGLGYGTVEGPESLAPGTSRIYTTDVTVGPLMLDALHTGPTLTGGVFSFWMTGNGGMKSAGVPAPPVAYTAPTPVTVSTSFDMTEVYGFEAGKLVEGDQVRYITRVTNTSSVTLAVTGTGYDSPAGPQSLAGGASMDFYGAPVTVTYNDMANAGVAFADASVDWSVGSLSGTVAAPVGTAPTEAIDASFDSSVSYAVNTTAGASVPLGDAVAGDVIDFTVDVSSLSNVTLNYVGISLDGSWGPASDAQSKSNSAFLPGTTLPNGTVKGRHLKSSGNGVFAPYALTGADIARGYVDLTASVQAAPSQAVFDADPVPYTSTTSERVFLRNFNTKVNFKFTDATLNDTNGDGIGQEGETITYRVRFKNNADQPLMIDTSGETAASHVPAPLAGAFNGVTVDRTDTVAHQWDYAITAADVTRGRVVARAFVDYHGATDSATNSRTAKAARIDTGVHVAPASTLDTAATYDDANLDGFPSIGETVHVTVTVNNTGTYALTGLTVADAAGADVTGLLPIFPTSVAAGASAVETFDYVLTAADFARGSLGYSTEMTATGLPTTASATSVSLTGITFQAYATDLDAMPAGGISVCHTDRTATSTITLLGTIIVEPGETCSYAGLAFGYRVVGFSTPLMMATDSFTMTVPVALHVGPHRLAVYAPNGTLVGWKAVTAQDPIAFAGPEDGTDGVSGGSLANTGVVSDEIVGIGGNAVLLVLLGTAFVIADSRRRKHSVRS